MEKTVTTTNDNVKNAAYGVDESGRTYVGNMLRNTVNPWQTIEEIQRRFSLPAPECNGALQFLSALEASNCSINLFLLDGLTAQLDALIDKLDQRSRLDLLKQSIKLIEVKELQFISVSIMKRLDIIPDKYLRGLISRELISVGYSAYSFLSVAYSR